MVFQARVIRNLATKLFDSLKNDPENSVAILQAGRGHKLQWIFQIIELDSLSFLRMSHKQDAEVEEDPSILK